MKSMVNTLSKPFLSTLSKATFLIAVTLITSFALCQNAEAKISVDQAKKIALGHSKVNERDATFEKVEFGKERGVEKYEVEFYTHSMEYEYEINAQSGKILEFSQEKRGGNRHK